MNTKYKGYTAVMCSSATWQDYNHSKSPIAYYRLDLITPYSLDMGEEDLLKRLKLDLEEVFGEVGHYSLIETNKRAYKYNKTEDGIIYAYNCFGCLTRQNFKQNRWEVTLLLHDCFMGFSGNTDIG